MSGDSKELEDLFDSIAAQVAAGRAASTVASAATAQPGPDARPGPSSRPFAEALDESADSEALQALFDSVAAAADSSRAAADHAAEAEQLAGEQWEGQDRVFRRVGQMARQLHDTLGQLGYHELLESTVAAIPDTRDRLNYVASLTEQAACRVLNAADIASPLLDELEAGSLALAARWDALFANQIGVEEFRRLAEETRAYLKQGLPAKTSATRAQLLEIVMAQDFQDLTGQVIKKIIQVAQDLEAQLMGVLIETLPGERRTDSLISLLNGPVINAEGRNDVVATQQQVDELLGSLGF